MIDVQNTYLERPDRAALSGPELARYDAWTPFHERMQGQVIPGIARDAGVLPGASASNACSPGSPATPRMAATVR